MCSNNQFLIKSWKLNTRKQFPTLLEFEIIEKTNELYEIFFSWKYKSILIYCSTTVNSLNLLKNNIIENNIKSYQQYFDNIRKDNSLNNSFITDQLYSKYHIESNYLNNNHINIFSSIVIQIAKDFNNDNNDFAILLYKKVLSLTIEDIHVNIPVDCEFSIHKSNITLYHDTYCS